MAYLESTILAQGPLMLAHSAFSESEEKETTREENEEETEMENKEKNTATESAANTNQQFECRNGRIAGLLVASRNHRRSSQVFRRKFGFGTI
jgi:hypothetical protein